MNQPARSRLLAHVLVAVALACGTQACLAGETSVTVNAVVLKRATLSVLSQPPAVVVSTADIARGYVDVPAPTQVAVKNNTSAGYLLELAADGDFIRQIVVRGLGSDVQLNPEGGLIPRHTGATGRNGSVLELGFRFLLSESAQAGTYAWPMRLAIAPL